MAVAWCRLACPMRQILPISLSPELLTGGVSKNAKQPESALSNLFSLPPVPRPPNRLSMRWHTRRGATCNAGAQNARWDSVSAICLLFLAAKGQLRQLRSSTSKIYREISIEIRCIFQKKKTKATSAFAVDRLPAKGSKKGSEKGEND